MERVDNKLFTLPGTAKQHAQLNYISGKGAVSGQSHLRATWLVCYDRGLFI